MEFNARNLHTAEDFYNYFASIPENLRPYIPVSIDQDEEMDETETIHATGELYSSKETSSGLDGGITLTYKGE
jgi:hypothetical protein